MQGSNDRVERSEDEPVIDLRARLGGTPSVTSLSARESTAWGSLGERLAQARLDARRVAAPDSRTAPAAAPPAAAAPAAAAPAAARPAPRPVVDQGPGRNPDRSEDFLFPWLVAAVIVLLVAGAAFWWTARGSDEPASGAAPAGQQQQAAVVAGTSSARAFAWLATHTVAGTRVLVPGALLDQASAALPGRAVVIDPRASADPPDLAVTTGGATPEVGEGWTTSPLAAFDGTAVSQVVPSTVTIDDEVEQRVQAGGELLANPALTATPRARAAMVSGEVDPRLLIVLAGLALDHQVTVDVPPAAATSAPGALRRSAVIEVAGDGAAGVVSAFVNAQSRVLVPLSVTAGSAAGASVLYPVPTPLGLLSGAGFPTVAD